MHSCIHWNAFWWAFTMLSNDDIRSFCRHQLKGNHSQTHAYTRLLEWRLTWIFIISKEILTNPQWIYKMDLAKKAIYRCSNCNYIDLTSNDLIDGQYCLLCRATVQVFPRVSIYSHIWLDEKKNHFFANHINFVHLFFITVDFWISAKAANTRK